MKWGGCKKFIEFFKKHLIEFLFKTRKELLELNFYLSNFNSKIVLKRILRGVRRPSQLKSIIRQR